jgi:hypothetical protein
MAPGAPNAGRCGRCGLVLNALRDLGLPFAITNDDAYQAAEGRCNSARGAPSLAADVVAQVAKIVVFKREQLLRASSRKLLYLWQLIRCLFST